MGISLSKQRERERERTIHALQEVEGFLAR